MLDRAEARKNKIKKAAEQCFLKKGLMTTSMRDIAGEAGVSLGNLYQYFPDKEALLKSFIVDSYLEVKAGFAYAAKQRTIIKSLRVLVKGYIDEVSDKFEQALLLDVYAAALRDDELLAYLQQYDDEDKLLADMLTQAKQQGELDFTLDAKLAAYSIISILEAQGLKVLTECSYNKKQAMAESWHIIQLLLNIKQDW